MRIRTIKPEFWAHPVLSRLTDEARLTAIGLLNYADDEGFFLADEKLVRSALHPFDEDSTRTRRILDALSRIGYIQVCEHETQGRIGFVVNFTKHQKIDRANKSKLKCYFNFDECSTNDRRLLDERSATDQGSGNRDQGMELGAKVAPGGMEPPTASLPDFALAEDEPDPAPKTDGTDDQWISALSRQSAYAHIASVRSEWEKMQNWCRVNRKKPTRRRFVAWLNRIETPFVPQQQRKQSEPLVEPDGWREWLEREYPGNAINADQRPWHSVEPSIRAKFCGE